MGYAVEIEASRANTAIHNSDQKAESVLIMDFTEEGTDMRAQEGDIGATVDAFIANIQKIQKAGEMRRVVFTSKTSAKVINTKQESLVSSYVFAPEQDKHRLYNCLAEKLVSAGFLKEYRRWV